MIRRITDRLAAFQASDPEAKAWRVLGSLSVVVFLVTGSTYNTIGIFTDPIGGAFHKSPGETAILATIFLGAFYLAGPFVGWLIDSARANRVMAFGAAVGASGYFLGGLGTSFPTMTLAFALAGIGVGASTNAPSIAIIGKWFKHRVGFGVGAIIAAGALGSAVMPPLVAYALTVAGWREAMLGIGVGILAVGVPLTLLAIPGNPNGSSVDARHEWRDILDGLSSAPFWLVGVTTGLGQLGVMGAYVGFVPFAVSLGHDIAFSGLLFGVMNIFSAIGCVGIGLVADRWGARRVLLVTMILNALFLFMLAGIRIQGLENAILYLVVVFWGLVQSAPYQLAPVLLAELVGQRAFGALSGALLLFVGLVSAGGPMVAGALHDATRSHLLALMGCGGVLLLSAPLTLFLGARRTTSDQALRIRTETER